MRLLKPAWVAHDGKPIFSIDIHPDSSRFATGGQGDNNSGKVAIWSMAPVRDENAENDENVPKLICQMDNHLACVNCVRWSNDGRYLASASDDKLIMIWQFSRTGGMSAAFGSEDRMINIETWRAVYILRGHTGDVLSISWSPDSTFLASCSIDNTIIVWNALKFPDQTAILRGHTGMVKGVTWDPIGKYLASQSDDRTVRVWRTYNWKAETVVSEPFKECGGTTHVLRLDWSPDGQYIVSAHAMNNSGPTAQIIERGNQHGWQTKKDFVGHRKAITVVRFNDRIFSKKFKKNPDKVVPYTCCAIGSRDRSVSVWLTALQRPLVVMHDLFNNSVLDISWSSSGTEFMCCSWDGTVAYFEFDVSEIGNPMTIQEKSSFHKKLYGESVLQPKNSAANCIIESSEVLELQEQNTKAKQRPRDVDMDVVTRPLQVTMPPPLSTADSNSSISPFSKQIETRTKDGRRRITPIFIAPQPDIGDTPQPFTSAGRPDKPVFSSSTETSSIVVEKKDEITASLGASCSSRMIDGSSKSLHDVPDADMNAAADDDGFTGAVLPSGTDAVNAVTVPSTAQLQSSTGKAAQELSGKTDGLTVESPQQTAALRTKASTDEVPKKKDGRGRPRKDRTLELAKSSGTPVSTAVVVDKESVRTLTAEARLRLPVPSIDVQQSFPIAVASADPAHQLSIELESSIRVASLPPVNRLRCSTGSGHVVWESVITSKLNAVATSSVLVCAASEDCCLHVFSTPSGRRLCPAIALPSAVSQLLCSAAHVMVVTSQASVFVWNMQVISCSVRDVTLEPLLCGGYLTLTQCQLTDQGLPVVTVSSGKSYTYNSDMASWFVLSSPDDVLFQCSDHQTAVSGTRLIGPLADLQRVARQRSTTHGSRLLHSDAATRHALTISHLENQLTCCVSLRSSKEYHFWLLTYVRYLVQEGVECKLRELCDELLGPVHGCVQSRWTHSILGYKKHSLLREILPIIGAELRLQRLFSEYQQQLISLADG